MMRSWLVLSLCAAGCNLYWGGDDQPPQCGDYKEIPAYDVRNPDTGECQSIGWGYCSDQCPCPLDDVAIPDWPTCGGTCDALDEQSCLQAPGCHADYTGFACPPNADCSQLWSGITFWQCSAVAPSGPIEGGDCWSLDAQTCSEHDDCATTYQIPEDPPDTHHFNQCIPEPVNIGYGECLSDTDCPSGDTCDTTKCYPPPGCDPSTGACTTVCYGVCVPKQDVCAGVDCGPGAHCETQCYACDPPGTNGCMDQCQAVCVPDQLDCTTVDCAPGYHCEDICTDPPSCDPSTGKCPPSSCGPQCMPDNPDPGDCYGQVTCGVAPPSCPAGTTPGTANGCYTGFCIPISECKHDPGTCDGPVLCNSAPPACPLGTVPGIANGCWSGYCIPTWACPQPTCESITDEKTCLARGDCTAVYDGMNCTCDPSGVCTCTSQTFARCESAIKPQLAR